MRRDVKFQFKKDEENNFSIDFKRWRKMKLCTRWLNVGEIDLAWSHKNGIKRAGHLDPSNEKGQIRIMQWISETLQRRSTMRTLPKITKAILWGRQKAKQIRLEIVPRWAKQELR